MVNLIISPDQNTVTFKDKEYHFVKTETFETDCKFCQLNNTEACEKVPCMPQNRKDQAHGYFTNH